MVSSNVLVLTDNQNPHFKEGCGIYHFWQTLLKLYDSCQRCCLIDSLATELHCVFSFIYMNKHKDVHLYSLLKLRGPQATESSHEVNRALLVLLIVFKCLYSLAPSCKTELIQPRAAARALQSSDQLLLAAPRSSPSTRGDRTFTAERLWNRLPPPIGAQLSIEEFWTLLKTHWLSLAFTGS